MVGKVGSMRKTIASWEELCGLIKQSKDRDEHIILKPISWYGEMEKDRKSKRLKSEVGKVDSIIFEIEVVK